MATHMCTSLCVPICTNLQRRATGGPVTTFVYLPNESGCEYLVPLDRRSLLGYEGRHRA